MIDIDLLKRLESMGVDVKKKFISMIESCYPESNEKDNFEIANEIYRQIHAGEFSNEYCMKPK